MTRRCQCEDNIAPRGAPMHTIGTQQSHMRQLSGSISPAYISRHINATIELTAIRMIDVGVATRSLTQNSSVSIENEQMSSPLPPIAEKMPPRNPPMNNSAAFQWNPISNEDEEFCSLRPSASASTSAFSVSAFSASGSASGESGPAVSSCAPITLRHKASACNRTGVRSRVRLGNIRPQSQ